MQQPTACPHCNAVPVTAKARFCGKCGKPLTLPQIAVVSPAFAAPITPTFQHQPRRILFACTASPIIGVGLGAEPAALFGLWLKYCGLPEVIVPFCAATGFISLTALIAYIILSDKISFLSAITGRRKVESVLPRSGELNPKLVEPGQFQQELPHQWAKQPETTGVKR